MGVTFNIHPTIRCGAPPVGLKQKRVKQLWTFTKNRLCQLPCWIIKQEVRVLPFPWLSWATPCTFPISEIQWPLLWNMTRPMSKKVSKSSIKLNRTNLMILWNDVASHWSRGRTCSQCSVSRSIEPIAHSFGWWYGSRTGHESVPRGCMPKVIVWDIQQNRPPTYCHSKLFYEQQRSKNQMFMHLCLLRLLRIVGQSKVLIGITDLRSLELMDAGASDHIMSAVLIPWVSPKTIKRHTVGRSSNNMLPLHK